MGLISIHQVLFKPLVEMMITELSTPLASNKHRLPPVFGKGLRMTDFSSDSLLEPKCYGMMKSCQCMEMPPFFSVLLISEMNFSVSVLLL